MIDVLIALEGSEISGHEAIGGVVDCSEKVGLLLFPDILSDLLHDFSDVNLLHVFHEVSFILRQNIPPLLPTPLNILSFQAYNPLHDLLAYPLVSTGRSTVPSWS